MNAIHLLDAGDSKSFRGSLAVAVAVATSTAVFLPPWLAALALLLLNPAYYSDSMGAPLSRQREGFTL